MRKIVVFGLLMSITLAMSVFGFSACTANENDGPNSIEIIQPTQPETPSENSEIPNVPEQPDDPYSDHTHNLRFIKLNPATCESAGNIEHYVCVECGLKFSDVDGKTIIENCITPATGHDYAIGIVAPTCTERGYTIYKCKNCNDVYTVTINPLEHKYIDEIVAPTCTQDGYTLHCCEKCSHEYTDNEILSSGHSYKSVVIESTCVSGGYTVEICDSCGDEIISDHTAASGHEFGDPIVIARATCTKSGLQERICERCGERESTVLLPRGHNYTVTVIDPTCTDFGYTLYVCSACNDTFKDNETVATGHRYNEVWEYDDYGHWHEAICGCDITSEKFEHEHDDNGDCMCGHKEEWDYKLTYISNGDGYTVTGIRVAENIADTSLAVVIPSEYNGLPVTAIADYAFKGNRYIKSIEIPASVKKIGKGAFSGCVITSAIFKNTGWTCSKNENGSGATVLTLGNSVNAAKLLKNTYADYYWFGKK